MLRPSDAAPRDVLPERIGFLNDLFYGRSYIAGPGEMSIPFLLDEKPAVVAGGWTESGREGRERFFIAPLVRTQSERRRRLALAGGFRLSDCPE